MMRRTVVRGHRRLTGGLGDRSRGPERGDIAEDAVEFEVRRLSVAPAERVFDLIADAPGWPSWVRLPLLRSIVWDQAGWPEPGGVGAVRRIDAYLIPTVRERVCEFTPGRRMVYVLVSGLPLRDYRAEVTATPRPGGSTLTWRVRFRRTPLGTSWPVRQVMAALIGLIATRATRAGASALTGPR